MFETFVSTQEVANHLRDEAWIVVDCRAVLGDRKGGALLYVQEGHLPWAVYADLDSDMSGTVVPGVTGRHPLPNKEDWVETVRRLGISNDSQVVAYDGGFGQMAAARFWWLMRWAGHDAVAVMDGGATEWKNMAFPLIRSDQVPNPPGTFEPHFRDELIVNADGVLASLGTGELTLVDSRSADRYRGENETVDPAAGHIPGALSLPFSGNGRRSGKVLPEDELRARFEGVLGDGRADRTVFYCGSGVTAAQNVLSHLHAGLGMPLLYPGSWSEWITDPLRPVEK